MPPQELRHYQHSGRAQIFEAWRNDARSVLAVAPTGSGKTTSFSDIARHFALTLRAPVVILVHRRELATQASNRLREFGVEHGFILSGLPRQPQRRVQIASVQTLARRTHPPARLVICDEAHLSTANTWAKILASYPESLILGVTATPWRLSGKPLAGAYDACVVIAKPHELREQGHLCDYSGFSYLAPDLSDVKVTAGDYNEKQSEAAMRAPSIVANIVQQWQAHARDLSTVVFAVTVEHSKALTAEFKAAGVTAEHLDGTTPLPARAGILRRVELGTTRVLCNVGVAIEGLDIPRLKCCVLARPTKSLARYLQMTGRVRRPWQGVKARIHDHAFLIKAHGLPDDDRDYRLTAKKERPVSELKMCPPPCGAWYSGPKCPECESEAAAPTERRELVTVDDAEQFEFDSNTAKAWLTPEDLPLIDVRWETPGRALEGRLTATTTEQASFGPRKFYTLAGTERRYRFPGVRHLDTLMTRARVGDLIRVTYLGTIEGSQKKTFKLEVDR